MDTKAETILFKRHVMTSYELVIDPTYLCDTEPRLKLVVVELNGSCVDINIPIVLVFSIDWPWVRQLVDIYQGLECDAWLTQSD